MNLNFLCCVGAELKNSTTQTTRMPQIYFYRAFEDETIENMLSPGFFNAAMGIIRKDDLLLLYGPNDSVARYVYARVSEITRNGVVIEKIDIDARDIYVNTDNMSNLHKHTLQEVIAEIDAEITRLDDRIDEEIERAKSAEGDMQLPIIINGATAPTNLSEAIRQLNEQTIDTITQDDQAPTPGNWKLWDAIKKCFSNAVYFFAALVGINARLNALEGRGGPVGAYDFGKAMNNPISDADQQTIIGVMIDNIWTGHTPIEWKTPIYDSSFNDSLGVAHTAADIFNATWIRNTFDGTRLVLTNTLDTDPKVFSIDNVGVDVVSFANTTTAGIVRTGAGSDMTTDQTTGDISIDDSKGFSIWNRITALFTPQQSQIIQQNLRIAGSPFTAVQYGIVNYVMPNKNFMQADFDPVSRPSGNKNALRIIGGTILKMPSGAIFQAGTEDLVVPIASIAVNMPAAGMKGYVYLKDNNNGTASLEVDNTGTANGRYLIGGFVLMCPLRGGSFTNLPTTHPFYSYSNAGGEIMHTSVWHLKNAYDQKLGACAYNPEKRLWVQIYVPSLYNSAGQWQSGSYSTSDGGGTRYTDSTLMLQSVYNASPSNNMTFGEQSQWLKMAGGRYIFDDEFTSTAEGSNEQTNVNGSNQKNQVGGWHDTNNRPMISNFGIWEMNGFYWQDIGLSAAGGSAWQSQGLNKGQTYGGQRLRAGAAWIDSTNSGSLSRYAPAASVVRSRFVASRGASPCYEIL